MLRDTGPDEVSRLEAFVNEKKKSGPQSVHQRVRGLSAAEQMRCAREGEISERTALERGYGKAVWEALLENPRISVPEVARIARKGNVPRPLLEKIVGNAAWLGSSEVRRALLSNSRLGGAALRETQNVLSLLDRETPDQVQYASHLVWRHSDVTGVCLDLHRFAALSA